MEIRRMLRGTQTSFAPAVQKEPPAPARKSARPSADRLELSRWMASMDQERLQAEQAFYRPSTGDTAAARGDGGLLGLLDEMETKEKQMDAMEEALDAMDKCLKIAARIMAGKKVPKQDEDYLRLKDPKGYQMAILLQKKETGEKCKTVLDEDDLQDETEARGSDSDMPLSGSGDAPAE
ncbi:hypothetical protein D1159_00655 [Pseudoflavonifractor sp. 524-17]|uniref:hypothetical protein n=1 Tax=Pseudoflavonifractor sp. 524-17 TaxID=2304577 RepID=UPI00137A8583|nr:hypothetical protein [Pseudoflavonifractor sp. 524-17]NCE63122.1 hypothetical protein [Pseudoflavonifractor sp. 524-17]